MDEAVDDIITAVAKERCEGNESQAFRWIVTEFDYMRLRFEAFSRRPVRQVEPSAEIRAAVDGAGGGA